MLSPARNTTKLLQAIVENKDNNKKAFRTCLSATLVRPERRERPGSKKVV